MSTCAVFCFHWSLSEPSQWLVSSDSAPHHHAHTRAGITEARTLCLTWAEASHALSTTLHLHRCLFFIQLPVPGLLKSPSASRTLTGLISASNALTLPPASSIALSGWFPSPSEPGVDAVDIQNRSIPALSLPSLGALHLPRLTPRTLLQRMTIKPLELLCPLRASMPGADITIGACESPAPLLRQHKPQPQLTPEFLSGLDTAILPKTLMAPGGAPSPSLPCSSHLFWFLRKPHPSQITLFTISS